MKDIDREVSDYYLNTEIESYDKLLDNEFQPGEKLCWVYKDDIDFWEKEYKEKITKKNFKKWANYEGIIVPLEDVEIRGSIYIDDLIEKCFICITKFPTEKCYPDTAWVSFGELVGNRELVWIGKSK